MILNKRKELQQQNGHAEEEGKIISDANSEDGDDESDEGVEKSRNSSGGVLHEDKVDSIDKEKSRLEKKKERALKVAEKRKQKVERRKNRVDTQQQQQQHVSNVPSPVTEQKKDKTKTKQMSGKQDGVINGLAVPLNGNNVVPSKVVPSHKRGAHEALIDSTSAISIPTKKVKKAVDVVMAQANNSKTKHGASHANNKSTKLGASNASVSVGDGKEGGQGGNKTWGGFKRHRAQKKGK